MAFEPPPTITTMFTHFLCGLERCDLVGSDTFCNRYLRERITLKGSPCLSRDRIITLSCCLTILIINNIAESDFDVCADLATATVDVMRELAAAIRMALACIRDVCPDGDGGPFTLLKFVIPVWVTATDLKTYVYHIVFSFEDADDPDDSDALIFTYHEFIKKKGEVLKTKVMPFNFFQGVDLDTTYGDSTDSNNVFGNADDVFVPLPLTDYYDYC